jgi:hypothetical protein
MCSSLAAVAAGRQPAPSADPLSSLRAGSLVVWEAGSPQLLDWGEIRAQLAADFPGLRVLFRLVQPQQLMDELAKAQTEGSAPDAVFVDNWTQGGALIAQQHVIEMMGRSRFSPSRGWWFLMREGQYRETATAFLHWLEDDPHWIAPPFSTVGLNAADRPEIAAAAVLAVSSLGSGSAATSIADTDAISFSTQGWGTYCGSVTGMANPQVRFLAGNGRLAFAALTSEAGSTGGKTDCGGLMQSFVVLRKHSDGWKVLLLMPSVSLAQATSFGDNFSRLGLTPANGTPPAPPTLLSPYDGEPQTRFPKQQISWRQNSIRPAAYVVESRFGVAEGGFVEYGPSTINFVDPAQYGDVVRMPMPFGVGMQPHRWRVWAIGKDGEVALSEWRTVDFTN